MSDISKINGVNYADVAKINGFATADIAKFNSATVPASSTGASYWFAVGDDRRVGYITDADLKAGNDWTDYDAFAGGSSPNPSSGNDHISVAYGKDENGDEIWVATYASDAVELAYKEGIPSSGPWTGVNALEGGGNLTGRRFQIQWGNDVWIAVGKVGGPDIFRSVNGKDWNHVNIGSVTNVVTNESIYALASNGTGTWWFAQENRIYQSTNDGAAWSLLHTLVDSSNANPGDIRVLEYTNATLFAGVKGGECFTAAASDLTDWSTETTIVNHGGACFDQDVRVAAAGGRVIAVGGQLKSVMDINGKTITVVENGVDFSSTSHGTLSSISTDGTGTWCVSCFTGDMFFSTDNGINFTDSEQNMGSKDMLACAPNVTLPL